MISTETLVYILTLISVIALFVSATNVTREAMLTNANKGASMLLTSTNALHYTLKTYSNMNFVNSERISGPPANCRIDRPVQNSKYKISRCKAFTSGNEFISVALSKNSDERKIR